MSEAREAARAAFLARHGLADAALDPLPGDASFRRYVRLPGRGLMLMDAPPLREALGPYLAVARHLTALGFSAPAVHAADEATGFALIEDFGDGTFTRLLAAGADETALYTLALDTLAALHAHPDATRIDLPPYDTQAFLDEVALYPDWYSPVDRKRWLAAWQHVLDALPPVPAQLVLRDYHVDNLMRLDGRVGTAACGLLDFQDARLGPAAYDLASLLEDARRDVPRALAASIRARYRAARGNAEPHLDLWYDVLAAQRHAKVAGIFSRLDKRDGKPAYLAHLPRVTRLLGEALARQPTLEPVRRLIA